MDENKIAIIIYKSTNHPIDHIMAMLNTLTIPQGFSPLANIVGGVNRWRAYNQAMKALDAKYKIYIDERIEFLNKNILVDLIDIFRSDKTIGMIGSSGAITLSTNGNTYDSAKRCGKIVAGPNKGVLKRQDVEGRWQEVEVLDGFMLATQYDIDWRDDLFNEDSFGDSAQCVEFRRRGYKCVVPHQAQPWLWYHGEIVPYHETAHDAFLKEYSKDLFPLVQILLPTLNRPQFFPIALESAINQTYRNIEIVVSDNSTNEQTYAAVQPYLAQDSRIKYFRHDGSDPAANGLLLNKYWKEHLEADYFNWLHDDDMFYPTKIEKMVEAYRNNPDVSIVSSRRHNIDENGRVLREMTPLHNKTEKLSGETIGKYLLMYTANQIGEPTTVLMNKKFLADYDTDFWRNRPEMRGRGNAVGDYSQWLYLLERGNIFWINEILSARREHSGQSSQLISTWVKIYVDFALEVNEFWSRKKFLTTQDELRHTIIVWLTKAAAALQRAFFEGYNGNETIMIQKIIPAMAEALNNGGIIKFPKIT